MEHTQTPLAIPDKLFYKAVEVCQITDTQPYVLRFWESEFPQLASEKNRSGQRVYRRADIDLVFRIKQLLYQEEYTIAGARKAIDESRETLVDPPSGTSRQRRVMAAEEILDPEAPAAAPAPAPASLFGETRPESPDAPASAAADDEARYRTRYEATLAALNNLKVELARSDGQVDAIRDRNRRIAARIEAALQS